MDRFGAIVWMAGHARTIIDVQFARSLCGAIGVPFDALLRTDPGLVRAGGVDRDSDRRHGWLVRREGLGRDLVQVSDLAMVMAMHMGLYANRDHARASQHGTPGREAQYRGQRACVRLAFALFGKSGHTDRYGDDPAVIRLVQEVPSIRIAGVRRKARDDKGTILGHDGRPMLEHGDQLLIEKVYKPQAIEVV